MFFNLIYMYKSILHVSFKGVFYPKSFTHLPVVPNLYELCFAEHRRYFEECFHVFS